MMFGVINFVHVAFSTGGVFQLLANATNSQDSFLITLIVSGIIGVTFLYACMWRIFEKAGRPGWQVVIPVYSNWVLFEIVRLPGWLVLIMFVPYLGQIVLLWAIFRLGKAFGKSNMFSVLLVIFLPILLPMLAFGSDQFQGNGSINANLEQTDTTISDPTVAAPIAPVAQSPTIGQISAVDSENTENEQNHPPTSPRS